MIGTVVKRHRVPQADQYGIILFHEVFDSSRISHPSGTRSSEKLSSWLDALATVAEHAMSSAPKSIRSDWQSAAYDPAIAHLMLALVGIMTDDDEELQMWRECC